MKKMSLMIVFLMFASILIVIPTGEAAGGINMYAYADKEVYYPEDVAHINYGVYNDTTGEVISSNGDGNWTLYEENGIVDTEVANDTFTSSSGTIDIDLSDYSEIDAGNNNYYVDIEYVIDNITSAFTTVSFEVEEEDYIVSVSAQEGNYVPGSYIKVGVDFDNPWEGNATIKLVYDENYDNDTNVGEDCDETDWNNIKTDSDGDAYTLVQISDNYEFGWHIIVKVDIGPSDHQAYFTISGDTNVYVEFDKERYLAGDLLTATTYVVGTEIPDVTAYHYTLTYNGQTIDFKISENDTFTYKIPDDFEGYLYLYVDVYSDEGIVDSDSEAVSVVMIDLDVYTNKDYYSVDGGDSITVTVVVTTNMDTSNLQYIYMVTARDGKYYYGTHSTPYLSEESSSNTYTFTVPENPADSYRIKVVVETGGYTAEDTTWIEVDSQNILYVDIADSSYVIDTYAPGDTITIDYRIKIVDEYTEFPSEIYISYSFRIFGDVRTVVVNSLEGEFQLTVPSDIGDGEYLVMISAYDCEPEYISINVQSDSSGWMSSIAGMPAGQLVLLILVIITLIIALYNFKRGKEPSMSSEEEILEDEETPQKSGGIFHRKKTIGGGGPRPYEGSVEEENDVVFDTEEDDINLEE